MEARAFCDDCGHGCAEGCVYLGLGEQPKFVCFRLAKRILPGEPWNTWDYTAWIRAEWRAFGKLRGISEQHYAIHNAASLGWLTARHGHPCATTYEEPRRVPAPREVEGV